MAEDIYTTLGIDKTKLKRDYIKEPIFVSKNGIGSEKPYKEDLDYLYNVRNLEKTKIVNFFNTTDSTLSRWLRLYKIKKNISNRIKNTIKSNKMKYGVDNVFQLNTVKDKITETNIKKYNKRSSNQININDDIYPILYDCSKLKKFIEDNCIHSSSELSKIFNIGVCAIDRYLKKYNLYNLFDYSKSSIEQDIRNYINKYFETENNNRNVLNGKEIDIYIPKLNIGIEFNGNYWHSEKVKSNKFFHQEKSLVSETNGVFLYHIFEYEWINNKDKIINQLNNLLGLNQTKIYARKCVIKEVNNEEKSIFLDTNHMQGNDVSSIRLGLYYNEELVSLMTFVKPRFNKNYKLELSRFCSKAGTNVIGGASKLWNYFIKHYRPESVISYSNIAHTKGNLYRLLGFKLQRISEPNYVWCKGYKILTRYQCQKHKLLEQGFTNGNSENEIMHNNGYYKIYDCGNKVWVWRY